MADGGLLQQIDETLNKQLQWRRIMSVGYFLSSASAILASGAATVVAAIGLSTQAAILAGSATVLYGLEKALLMRERWAQHLSTSSQLEALRLEYKYGNADEENVVMRFGQILTEYSTKLPIERRKNA